MGGNNSVKANVRVIAATHQDLEQRVKEGGFREDLFHRLNVIRLRLPALRERLEDIPMLTRHFLQQSAKQLGVEPKRIADAALVRLGHFAFPGNVRQLENICHWLTVMAPAQVVEPKDLPPEVLASQPFVAPEAGPAVVVTAEPVQVKVPMEAPLDTPLRPSFGTVSAVGLGVAEASDPADGQAVVLTALPASDSSAWEQGLEAEALSLLATGRHDVWDGLSRRFESRLILTALSNTKGRRIEAAQKLGIGRNTITRKIQELGLE